MIVLSLICFTLSIAGVLAIGYLAERWHLLDDPVTKAHSTVSVHREDA